MGPLPYPAVSGIQGEARASIAAAPGACMAVLVGFEAYPEWYPSVQEVSITERDPERGVFAVEAFTRLPVKTVSYRLRYTVEGTRSLRGEYLGGDLKSLAVNWRLEAAPEGPTEATLSLKGEVGWVLDRLLAPVRDAVRRELIDDAVAALKRRVEEAPAEG